MMEPYLLMWSLNRMKSVIREPAGLSPMNLTCTWLFVMKLWAGEAVVHLLNSCFVHIKEKNAHRETSQCFTVLILNLLYHYRECDRDIAIQRSKLRGSIKKWCFSLWSGAGTRNSEWDEWWFQKAGAQFVTGQQGWEWGGRQGGR